MGEDGKVKFWAIFDEAAIKFDPFDFDKLFEEAGVAEIACLEAAFAFDAGFVFLSVMNLERQESLKKSESKGLFDTQRNDFRIIFS